MLVVVSLVDFHAEDDPVEPTSFAVHRSVRCVLNLVYRQPTVQLATNVIPRMPNLSTLDAFLFQRPQHALVRDVEEAADFNRGHALVHVEPS